MSLLTIVYAALFYLATVILVVIRLSLRFLPISSTLICSMVESP